MKLFKILFLIIPLLFAVQHGYCQITGYNDAEQLFDGTSWESNLVSTEAYGTNKERYYYHYITSTDSSADTVVTQTMANRAFADHFVSITTVSDSAGTGAGSNPDTIIVYVEMGVFRGRGTVPGTAGATVDTEGILWKPLITITQDTSVSISLADSTWWSDFPSPQYWYRLRETSEQSNKYYISDFQFKTE